MTETQLFAEIRNAYKSYDSEGLIDEISIRRWMKSELKRFGNNIMIYSDDIVKVREGKGKLPEDFWHLQSAKKYDPSHFECEEESRDILQNSHFWLQKIEEERTFVDGKEVKVELKNCVHEEYYFHDARATLYYGNPQPLKLKKGFNRKAIEKDCANLPHKLKGINCHEINILGDYIQTDFREGFIYIRYKALPMNEEGEMYIPDTQHDRLKEYIMDYVKWRVAEDLWMNNDDPNLGNKIGYLKQKADDAFSLAMTEVKMSTLTQQTWQDIKEINQNRKRKIEIMFPNLNRRG